MIERASAKRMADVAEFTRKDAQERVCFLSIQVRIWRGLAIIHAHHPELAKESMLQMAMGGMMVGDLDRLERCQERINRVAQHCGKTLGVFADEGSQCNGLTTAALWREEEVETKI